MAESNGSGNAFVDNNRKSAYVLAALVLLLAAGFTLLFWPGVGTWDMLQFVYERRLPVMNDWKSPFVAMLYYLFTDLFHSTGPMLFVQQILLWSGIAMFAQTVFERTSGKVLFVFCLAILPPIWITGILIGKDTWTLCLLSFNVGVSFLFLKDRKFSYGVLVFLSAVLIALTRKNTILLVLPGIYIVVRTAADYLSETRKLNYRVVFSLIMVLAIAATLTTTWAVNERGKQKCYIWHEGLLWDLAAMSIYEHKDLIPDTFKLANQPHFMEKLKRYFCIYSSDTLFFWDGSPLRTFGTAWTGCKNKPPLKLLIRKWTDAVITYPKAYLHHRLSYVIHLLGIPDIRTERLGSLYPVDSEYAASGNRSGFFKYIYRTRFYTTLVFGPLDRGWVYMALFLLAIIGVPIRKSLAGKYLWILWVAGILYFASFAVIGSGALMRYLTAYALLGPVILMANLWLMRQRKQEAPQ